MPFETARLILVLLSLVSVLTFGNAGVCGAAMTDRERRGGGGREGRDGGTEREQDVKVRGAAQFSRIWEHTCRRLGSGTASRTTVFSPPAGGEMCQETPRSVSLKTFVEKVQKRKGKSDAGDGFAFGVGAVRAASYSHSEHQKKKKHHNSKGKSNNSSTNNNGK